MAFGIAWMMAAPAFAQYYGSDINDDLTAAARRALSQSALESHHGSTAAGHGPEVDLRIVFPSEQTGLDNIMETMLEPRDAGAHQCETLAIKSSGNVISSGFIPKKDVRPGHLYDVVVSDSMGDLYLVGRIRVGTASQQSYLIHAPLLTPGSPRYTPPAITSYQPASAPRAQTSGSTSFAQAIQDQALPAPMLGMRGTTVTPRLLALAGAKTRSFRGVIVAGISHGSLAERAGLRGGDVIVGVDGHPCGSIQQFVAVTQDRQASAKAVDIAFLRSEGNGHAALLHAKVPSARLLSLVSALQSAAKPVPALGLQGVTVTPELLALGGAHTLTFKGVGIFDVDNGSLAQRAGLVGGDFITAVNGRACASVEQLIAFSQLHERGLPMDLTVVRKDASGRAQTRQVTIAGAPASVGYTPPQIGPGYVPPSTGPGYVPPSTGPGYVPPSTGPGYVPPGSGGTIAPAPPAPPAAPPAPPAYPPATPAAPSTSPGYAPPTAGPGYIPPGAGGTIAPAPPAPPAAQPAPPAYPPATPAAPSTSPGYAPPTAGPGYVPPGAGGTIAPAPPAPPAAPPAPPAYPPATPAPPTPKPAPVATPQPTAAPTPKPTPAPTPQRASSCAVTEYAIPTFLSTPTSITVGPDGSLWFTEDDGNSIGRITTSGNFTEYEITTGKAHPRGIIVGPDGNLWFAEAWADQLGKITPSGTVSEYFLGNSNGPSGIAVGPNRNLWFTQSSYFAASIDTITPAGTLGTPYNLASRGRMPSGITVGPDGNLWFTEYGGNEIGRITPGGAIDEFATPTSHSGPQGIVAGPDGNLWFTEQDAGAIGKITPSGAITEFPIPTQASGPRDITVGPHGNLWFAESGGNKIGKITTAGVITECAVPTASSAPYGIVTGPDGNLWFTESAANKIGKLVP